MTEKDLHEHDELLPTESYVRLSARSIMETQRFAQELRRPGDCYALHWEVFKSTVFPHLECEAARFAARLAFDYAIGAAGILHSNAVNDLFKGLASDAGEKSFESRLSETATTMVAGATKRALRSTLAMSALLGNQAQQETSKRAEQETSNDPSHTTH